MANSASDGYRDDLAYIHDQGFGNFARQAAPWLLALFRQNGVSTGTVIDLGCGSGIWAKALVDAGYQVLGYDISAAMVKICRQRVPAGVFHHGSFLDAGLPACVAVTAMGEIFNYLIDQKNSPRRLERFFGRVFDALVPGGLFVFDVAVPGRVPGGKRQGFSQGEDWACLFDAEEDSQRKILTRRITSFRKRGAAWRRDHEVHRLRLYDRDDLLSRLRAIGFRVRTVASYGESAFPPGYLGIVARKP